MESIIDSLIDIDEQRSTASTQCIPDLAQDTDVSYICSDDIHQNDPVTLKIGVVNSGILQVSGTPRDFYYPNKEVGYLAQDDETFSFIGPDRQPIRLNSIDKLIQVVNLIRDSGCLIKLLEYP